MFDVSDAYKAAIAKQSRRFKLSGEIRLKSGSVVEITDSNVIGELSISTQMMSGSRYDDVIDIGAITSAVLSMTIKDDSSANSFADARVRLLVGLELEDGTYEYVKMGIFYIDSPSIQRVKNVISFTAYDKMIFLHYLLTDTMRSNMSGMDTYGAAGYLCSLVGIQLQQTHDEVAAFPNGDVALSFLSESLETARDVIMWCGQLMGCFTRITRSGKLEFVQIKAIQDDKNMIIPVREIQSSQRFSTKFADEVLRISTLTMKKSDGKIARAYLTGTSANKRSLELELEQNPLLTGQTVKSVASALKDMLTVLKTAYFRPFTSEIANDPALDAGDYVRLRGGSIDTSREYATGIITHSTWRYQGKQDIVNVGATPVLSQLEDDTVESAAAMALSAVADEEGEESGDISGEEVVFTQPKPQSGKYAAGVDSLNGVGKQSPFDPTSEIFNCYDGSNVAGGSNEGWSYYATARGTGNQATGFCSVACGQNNQSTGYYDWCGGYGSQSNGNTSFVFGNECVGSGYYTAVFGNKCRADSGAGFEFVSGSLSSSNVTGARVHGLSCLADYGSAWSTVLGEHCTSKGESSLVCGYYLVGSDVTGSAVLGRYNDDTLYNVIFAVGNGNNDGTRSNALTLDRYGNLTIPGTLSCANIVTTDDTAAASLLSDDTDDTLTYTAQSDNVVEFGGVTYTFTAAETGEYTGVTTSTGKTIAANIPAGLGNTQAHNAAFMALAIMSLK